MAVKGAVIALDDADAAAGFQQSPQTVQGTGRVGQVLEDEADEDVVIAGIGLLEGEEVALLEPNVGQARRQYLCLGLCQGLRRNIERNEAAFRVVAGQVQGLAAGAAAGLEHQGTGRIPYAPMQQIGQGVGLIPQSLRFAVAVTVNILHIFLSPSMAMV